MLGIHIFRFTQQLQDLACARSEAPVLRQALALRDQLFDLAGLEIEGLQLAEVIAQQLQPCLTILRGSCCTIALLAKLRPRAMLLAHRSEQITVVAALIEQLALRRASHQR
ncbi:MAG TPA: hypothetical protein VJR89_22585, partial [Polyangiales bacterium]|nr:hypothetical protein [Polyangiales bacterium]